MINLPKACADLGPHSEAVGLNQLLLGCHQASGQAGPGKVMRGPSVIVMKQSISVPAVAQWGRGAGGHWLAQPWSCDGPQSLPQSHLLKSLGPQKDTTGTSDTLSFLTRLWQKLWLTPQPFLGLKSKGQECAWGLVCLPALDWARVEKGGQPNQRDAKPGSLAPAPLPATSERHLQRPCD